MKSTKMTCFTVKQNSTHASKVVEADKLSSDDDLGKEMRGVS